MLNLILNFKITKIIFFKKIKKLFENSKKKLREFKKLFKKTQKVI